MTQTFKASPSGESGNLEVIHDTNIHFISYQKLFE